MPFGLNLWRFISGIGIGVELVTIDTYLAELVPKTHRGRVFAINQTVQFSVIPVVAFLAWQLVPIAPFGFDGWRWVVLIGTVSAVFVWWIRLRVPESPRWLATHGRMAEALRQMAELERRVQGETLAPPCRHLVRRGLHSPRARAVLRKSGTRSYLPRTVMLILFNIFQAVGFYGFTNWAPTLLISRGITITAKPAIHISDRDCFALWAARRRRARRPLRAQMAAGHFGALRRRYLVSPSGRAVSPRYC